MKKIIYNTNKESTIDVDNLSTTDIIAFYREDDIFILTCLNPRVDTNTGNKWRFINIRAWDAIHGEYDSIAEAIKTLGNSCNFDIYQFTEYKDFARWMLSL